MTACPRRPFPRFSIPWRTLLCGVALGVGLCIGPAWAEEFEQIPTRPGVTQPFLWEAPVAPKAAVILFAGGDGAVGVGVKDGQPFTKAGGNFLVRSRHKLADKGLFVVTIDAPSDQDGILDPAFRTSQKHADDVAALVAWIKAKINLPVWLVGTSMGTLSAANGAARLGAGIDGLILTSTVTKAGKKATAAFSGVLGSDLDKVVVPVLVMSHRNDGCYITPPEANTDIIAALTASPRKEIRWIEGGLDPKSEPCQAFAQHGYYGVEDQAVEAIASFILGQQ